MILVDKLLIVWAADGGIEPFDPGLVNPASIDLRLGHMWRDMRHPQEVIHAPGVWLTPTIVDYWKTRLLHPKDTVLHRSVLAITYEWINISNAHAAEIKLKTTPSRKGLGHPIADWVDPGYEGKLTLMLHCFQTIPLMYKQRIVQLVVQSTHIECEHPYSRCGHYQGQMVPTLPWDWNKAKITREKIYHG